MASVILTDPKGTAEVRLAKWAERVEHNKWLYVAKTVGIPAILIGLNVLPQI